jgi:uncharacterized protein YicC (UPF0701 family)
MQGASWVAKKSQIEAERHVSKIRILINEFENRTRMSLVNAQILEYNGQKVGQNRDWISSEMFREAQDLNKNFDSLFENVNYELSKANESMKK